MTTTTAMTTLDPCRRCGAQLESDDLRCAVCALLVPVGEGAGVETPLKVFRCQGCGAAMAWSAEKSALACGFCAGEVKLEELKDPPEQTEAWLPFQVDARAARAALQRWQKGLSWFRPGDLATSSKVDSLKAIYWPAWAVDAGAEVTWAADSNADAGRAAWAPHSGKTHLDFGGLLVGASRGLSEAEMRALSVGYDLGSKALAPSSLPQLIDESFDVQRSVARARVVEACLRTAEATVKSAHIPGKKFRKVKVALVLQSLLTTRVALPAWILAYRYGNTVYRVVIHGQEKEIVLGQAPWSVFRIAAVVVGGAVALALLITLIALVSRHR